MLQKKQAAKKENSDFFVLVTKFLSFCCKLLIMCVINKNRRERLFFTASLTAYRFVF